MNDHVSSAHQISGHGRRQAMANGSGIFRVLGKPPANLGRWSQPQRHLHIKKMAINEVT